MLVILFDNYYLEILSCIGEAGNLEAESMRLLKTHDICTDSYEIEEDSSNSGVAQNPLTGSTGPAFNSLQVFMKDLDPVTGEWSIPEQEIA